MKALSEKYPYIHLEDSYLAWFLSPLSFRGRKTQWYSYQIKLETCNLQGKNNPSADKYAG